MKESMLAAKTCEPCKTLKAQVFKMGDVVEHIHTGDVFKIAIIISRYGSLQYGPQFNCYSLKISDISLYSGHELKKYQAKK